MSLHYILYINTKLFQSKIMTYVVFLQYIVNIYCKTAESGTNM